MTVLRHAGRLGRSSRSVDVTSVVDSVDVHDPLIFVGPVDDAILPDARTAPAGQFAPERVAYLLWVSDQTPEAELDYGAYDSR